MVPNEGGTHPSSLFHCTSQQRYIRQQEHVLRKGRQWTAADILVDPRTSCQLCSSQSEVTNTSCPRSFRACNHHTIASPSIVGGSYDHAPGQRVFMSQTEPYLNDGSVLKFIIITHASLEGSLAKPYETGLYRSARVETHSVELDGWRINESEFDLHIQRSVATSMCQISFTPVYNSSDQLANEQDPGRLEVPLSPLPVISRRSYVSWILCCLRRPSSSPSVRCQEEMPWKRAARYSRPLVVSDTGSGILSTQNGQGCVFRGILCLAEGGQGSASLLAHSTLIRLSLQFGNYHWPSR